MTDRLKCSKCSNAMHSGASGHGPIFTCYGCGALWIDTVALEKAEQKRPSGNRLHAALEELDITGMEPTSLRCATSCNGELVTVPCREVIIELCTRCGGVFLDRGEREKLIGLNPNATPEPPKPQFYVRPEGNIGPRDGYLLDDIIAGLLKVIDNW